MSEGIRIAIVEDDAGLNELIRRRLVREGHTCFCFQKATEAITWFAHNTADLMILDLVLPDYSGEELISALQRNGVSIPFIVATGKGSETVAVRLLKQGARDYLVKNSEFLEALPSTIEMVWREFQLESLLSKAREKIRVQNATLSAINDFSPDAILSVDPLDKILSFNDPLLKAWDLSPDDMKSEASVVFRKIALKLPDPEEFIAKISSLSSSFKGLVAEELHTDGRFYELYSAPIVPGPDGVQEPGGRIWFFHDYTLHKLAQEQMRQAKIEAENNAKLRSRFFAVISHDVKTPLNSINGFASLLADTKLDSSQQDFVSIIKSSCAHLLVLINDILDLTKIEHGAMELHYQDVCLREILNDCLATFLPTAKDTGLELLCEIADDAPQHFTGDHLRLRQIFINLLGNAMKFTHKGSVSIRCRRDPSKQNFLLFQVADTGIGISKEIQKFLFEPFTQADPSIAQQYGGSGLGLAISRQLVEKMGGTLSLESEPGKGSTFSFSIPASPIRS